MEVKLVIKQGSLETEITLRGYRLMIEALLKSIKEAATKEDAIAEIK